MRESWQENTNQRRLGTIPWAGLTPGLKRSLTEGWLWTKPLSEGPTKPLHTE